MKTRNYVKISLSSNSRSWLSMAFPGRNPMLNPRPSGTKCKIKELTIDGKQYPVHQKNIEGKRLEVGVSGKTQTYRFETLWMGLNQKNHHLYKESDGLERQHQLERILIGNTLAFFKAMDHFVEEQIQVKGTFNEKSTRFKNKRMLAFEGMFTTNLQLPDYIGLGKSVARGFGTIKKKI